NLGRVEALVADQISRDARSAPLSELVVVVLMTDAVGIAGDYEDALRGRRLWAGRSLHISEELIDLVLGVTAQGSRSGREGRPRARIQDEPSLEVQIVQLSFELLLLARDRAQLISDPRARGKTSAGAEEQTRSDEGSGSDAGSAR